MAAAGEDDRGRGGNVIGGDAHLYGPTVQARDVHGGVHFQAPPAVSPPPPKPRQLLPITAHFTDRVEEHAALDRSFREGTDGDATHPLIVVNGPAGIGKTTFASRWLRTHESAFPDGQLYADLRGHVESGPADPGEILGQFLRAFGIASVPGDLAEQASFARACRSPCVLPPHVSPHVRGSPSPRSPTR